MDYVPVSIMVRNKKSVNIKKASVSVKKYRVTFPGKGNFSRPHELSKSPAIYAWNLFPESSSFDSVRPERVEG
jgi:hypothetical protein